MVLFDREFIAVPDDRKNQILYKWPDVSIRKFSRMIVEADQQALFINTGQVVGLLGPGRHQVSADEIPGLGILIDHLTGGNAYRAELYFVGTREYTGNPFGGRIDDVQDPQTGLVVTLRVFGDYSMRVIDPAKLVTNLTGTVNVTDNDKVTGWMSDQLLKVLRPTVTGKLVTGGWPILGISTHTAELEQAMVEAVNGQLEPYGIAVIRLGNFDINLAEQDEATLKELAKDTAYSRLAGSFQGYAAGSMMKGAGEGMAQGGAATGGAFLAAGLGMGGLAGGGAGAAAASGGPGPTPPPAPGFTGGGAGFVNPAPAAGGGTTGAGAAMRTCTACHADSAVGAKFCPSCGADFSTQTQELPQQFCTSCGAKNQVGDKFCASCGSGIAPPGTPSTPATPAS